MIVHVGEAKYLHDHVIWLRFNDCAEGEIELSGYLDGEMFAPLKDLDAFKSFRVDPELGTIVWQNGADLAPEFLLQEHECPGVAATHAPPHLVKETSPLDSCAIMAPNPLVAISSVRVRILTVRVAPSRLCLRSKNNVPGIDGAFAKAI